MNNFEGQQLGNYHLIRRIGRGGFADVYLGEHIHLNTEAAVKVLHTRLTNDEIEKFTVEARIVAQLKHLNIVQVLDFGIEETIPFLVMEYASNGTLEDFRPRGIPLPWVSIESYIKQIASALQYAHDNNYIHRDVKPKNMLLRSDPKEVVLSDFGIALISRTSSGPSTQEIAGTASYMAPEQIEGKAVLASDQYALGIVAYEWLSGDLPFHGSSDEVKNLHLHAAPPSLLPKIPTGVEQVLLKALQKDPQLRYSRVMDFADALVYAYQQGLKTTQYNFNRLIVPVADSQASISPTEIVSPAPEPSLSARSTTLGDQLTSQYHEVIQSYYSLINEYERKKKDFQLSFDQEKDTIEANLRKARDEANAEVKQVRQIVTSTELAIRSSQWQKVIKKSLLPPSQIEEVQNPAQQMTLYRIEANAESNRISSYLIEKTVLRQLQEAIIARFKPQWLLIIILLMLVCIVLIIIIWRVPGLICLSVVILLPLILGLVLNYGQATKNAERLRNSYISLLKAHSNAENMYLQQNEILQKTYQEQSAENHNRYITVNKNIDRALQVKLAQLRSKLNAYAHEANLLVAGWNDPDWQQWKPFEATTTVTRLGTWAVVGREEFPAIPALVACPGGENILFKTAGEAKNVALVSIQSIMLRLLATQPPGKVRFTLFDPIGMGASVATFMQLAYDDEKLVNSRVWTQPEHIEKQLADLSEHMENVIQKYLMNRYNTIDDYNAEAGEIAEPYRILVVIGFPANFTASSIRRLISIATNGPRCGVSILMLMDPKQSLPRGPNFSELEQHANVIAWNGQHFDWKQKYNNIRPSRLILDTLPPVELFQKILKDVGAKAKETQKVEFPFRRMVEQILPEGDWWADKNNTSEEIYVPLGPMGARRYQYLQFGKGTAHHALVVGKTGSGKTNLLQVLIVGLSLIYGPNELEFYLVDFKTVGFTPYASYRLPHARVVAIQSEREFGLSVLRGLGKELEERKMHFSKAGVQNITQYRTIRPTIRMPRILLLVDEFQEFFNQEDRIAKDAEALLEKLVRMGRAFGIHVMLGSQTLAGTRTLPRSTISQMAVRIALQCEEADSRMILSEDNTAARLLSRPGEAIYNAENGAVAGNKPFQCAWLPDEELQVYLNAVQQLAQRYQYSPQWTQNIFDGSRNADINENRVLRGVLKELTWPVHQQAITVWLGDPIDIKEPTSLQIRSQAGNNLLIVGQQQEIALSLLSIALLSLATQHAPNTARFYVLDFTSSESPYAGHLELLRERLPHDVKIAKRPNLSSIIIEISDELENRKEEEESQKPSIYLLVYGLQRARDLRQDEEPYARDTPESIPLSKRFSSILRDGPELGVHTLVWCDTYANVNRTLERGILREFDLRVVFQMSSEDSLKLIDSTQANKLSQHRALLFSEEKDSSEKFIPYELPSKEWLTNAIEQILQKN